jgi:hypothetical protein
MDFDQATKRLESEHRRRREEQSKRLARSHLSSPAVAIKMKQMEQYHRKQQEEKRENELREKRRLQLLTEYMNSIGNDRLGFVDLSSNQQTFFNGIHLKASSIHGQGDKVTLPPSILSFLAEKNLLENPTRSGQPLFLRLGIERDEYVYPSSLALRQLSTDTHHHTAESLVDDDDTDMISIPNSIEPYLDELAHKFASYTFATVIEFTEEEGCIGLPYDIAKALLDPRRCDNQRIRSLDPLGTIPTTIIEQTTTVDVSTVSNDNIHVPSELDTSHNFENQTAGHPAYGAFPVPTRPVHVSLFTKLPLGRSCSLCPTKDAIRNGFHRLKDIKYVLEQSLIKTRATLSIGDTVHAWFRGVRYDLTVNAVEPSDFGVVSCVNTDITVDIVSDVDDTVQESSLSVPSITSGSRLGGQVNSPPSEIKPEIDDNESNQTMMNEMHQISEEPLDGDNVVTIQIRGDGVTSKRRRFHTSTTLVRTLFAYAALENIIQSDGVNVAEYRLVTRYPRRVLDYVHDGNKTLLEVGMDHRSQIMLLLERVK